jgi:GNAT superfamily N-acetyltransferase
VSGGAKRGQGCAGVSERREPVAPRPWALSYTSAMENSAAAAENSAAPRIRRAVPADIDEIVELVVALAVYEKEPVETVRLTPEKLRRQLFGEHPAIFAHVAEAPVGSGRRIDGFALWFLNYSTWEGEHGLYLEDLFVRPEVRGSGLGKALLTALARTAVENGWKRLEWVVLKWNEPSIAFYRGLGAGSMDEWDTFRLTGDALQRLGGGDAPTSGARTPQRTVNSSR